MYKFIKRFFSSERNKTIVINNSAHALKIAAAVGAAVFLPTGWPVVVTTLISSAIPEIIDESKDALSGYPHDYPQIEEVLKNESRFLREQVKIITDNYVTDDYIISSNYDTYLVAKELLTKYRARDYSEREEVSVKNGLILYLNAVKEWLQTNPNALQNQLQVIIENMQMLGIDLKDFKISMNSRVSSMEEQIGDTTRRVAALETSFEHSRLPKELTSTFVPHSNSSSFIHREKEIADITTRLSSEKSVVIVNGFGGIGKSALAREIYSRMMESNIYDCVGWIDYKKDLKTSLLQRVSLPHDKDMDESQRWNHIQRQLKDTPEKKLLIIDNVDTDVSISQYPNQDKVLRGISGWPNLTVLLTSRLSSLSPYEKYTLDYLSNEDSIDLFYFYYNDGSEYSKPENKRQFRKEVKTLAIELANNHTYAIELLAKSAPISDLKDYVQKIRHNGFQFPKVTVDSNHDEVGAAMAEQLKKLFKMSSRSKEEQECIWNFAVLPINTMLTEKEAIEWFACDINALRQLHKEGWLIGENGYVMHSLVRDTVWLYQKEKKAPNGTAKEFIQRVMSGEIKYISSDIVYTELHRHLSIAIGVMQHSNFESINPVYKVAYISNLGYANYLLGYYKQAEEYGKIALTIGENIFDSDIYTTAMLNNLGLFTHIIGKPVEAEQYFLKAIALHEKSKEVDDSTTATIYDNLAGIYRENKDIINAELNYKTALNIRKKVFGTNHAEVAMSCNNLAGLYHEIGRNSDAEQYYMKALAIIENVSDISLSDKAVILLGIAEIYQMKGKYNDAESYYLKALTICENHLGVNHPNTATVYDKLAGFYVEQRKYAEAKDLYQKTIVIREVAFGTNHPDTATVYNNLGELYWRLGNYSEAELYFQKALSIVEDIFGNKHPSTAAIYNNLAAIYQNNGNYSKAERYYKNALTGLSSVPNTFLPDIAIIYSNLAALAQAQGNNKKAHQYHTMALAIEKNKK